MVAGARLSHDTLGNSCVACDSSHAEKPALSPSFLTGDSVIELLAGLPAACGTAVVLVTHEPRYAAWADRVISMRDGCIVDVAVAPAPPPVHEPVA